MSTIPRKKARCGVISRLIIDKNVALFSVKIHVGGTQSSVVTSFTSPFSTMMFHVPFPLSVISNCITALSEDILGIGDKFTLAFNSLLKYSLCVILPGIAGLSFICFSSNNCSYSNPYREKRLLCFKGYIFFSRSSILLTPMGVNSILYKTINEFLGN